MSPRILYLFPPNYREINDKFNVRGKRVIFAYAPVIFNPSHMIVHHPLIQHEKVHIARQNGNPEVWWERYIADQEFRLVEEIPAHIAEYEALGAHAGILDHVAMKLSSPLYGNLVDLDTAKRLIRDGSQSNTRPALSNG